VRGVLRIVVLGLAAVVLDVVDVTGGASFLVGCGGVCDRELDEAMRAVLAKAPNWAVAKARTDRIFIEAHGTTSLTGFGATLVEAEHAPSPESLIPHDIHARGPLDEPSLLFFQKTDGPQDEWPLIGVGYHRPFTPCAVPTLDDDGRSIDVDDWFVHEAGWHHVPAGDGGFTPATAADVQEGVVLDHAGCFDVSADDLRDVRPLFVRHGRAWTVHVWFADDRCPVVELADPYERTECVTARGCGGEARCEPSLDVKGRAFFRQGDCRGVCGPG
jgi:hypothetical protein